MRRILMRALIALVVVVLVIAGFVYLRSELALRNTWRVEEAALSIPADADTLARGEHLAITRGCSDCHQADFGGRIVMEVPPIGRMAPPNITRGKGGLPENFSDVGWERAVRHGIG